MSKIPDYTTSLHPHVSVPFFHKDIALHPLTVVYVAHYVNCIDPGWSLVK